MGMFDKDPLKKILHGGGETRDDSDRLGVEEKEAPQDVGPCGMVSVKGCLALDVERGGKEPVVSFQYVYISVVSEFTPCEFSVLFVGLTSWKLTVKGRNLRPLYDRLQDHCLRRIRQADRDFGGDEGKPFVTKLEILT